jgi:hypothetical protein
VFRIQGLGLRVRGAEGILNHSSGTRAAANEILLHTFVCLLICLSATLAAANKGFVGW